MKSELEKINGRYIEEDKKTKEQKNRSSDNVFANLEALLKGVVKWLINIPNLINYSGKGFKSKKPRKYGPEI